MTDTNTTVNEPVDIVASATDPEDLEDALTEANIPTLLMVLVHLTGDQRWLLPPYAPQHARGLDDNDSGGLPAHVQAEVRDAALEAVIRYNAGGLTPITPSPDEVARMLGVALAEDVPSNYGELLSEELGVISRDVEMDAVPPATQFEVLVIGSGLSGICAAIKLKAAGIAFTVIEKNDDIGGTWLENTYPGVGVDTPSHLYSFSFAKNSEWTRYFARGGEVFRYLDQLAQQHDLHDHIRFGTEVLRADFDESTGRWNVQIRNADGTENTISANAVISAVGMVNRPSIPSIRGLGDFAGPVMHTAQWLSDTDVRDKRIGVIGTGASAMQLVPNVVDEADRVLIFQRSKQWAVPHPNYQREVSSKVRALFEQIPFYLAWYRLRSFWNFSDRLHSSIQIDPNWPHPDRSINAINERHRIFLTEYIKTQLGDRTDLVDACIPDYPPYGKRPLIDNGWYRTVCRDDVDLITEGVDEVTATGIITSSGEQYPVDMIVLATGFKTLQMLYPMDIRGRSGKTLRGQTWGTDDARAYLGITVPDYPNFFIINGPNTNAGHGGSAIHSTEFQVRYIMAALKHMFAHNLKTVEPRDSTYQAYNEELDEALSRSVWSHPGMTTYYRNDAGRIVVSSPWRYVDYWARTVEFEPKDYACESTG
ncbi:MAG: NAD(P)/FAD-dependent oxidoreductase [Rhodococcus sp. (in: high G+C Gram-positive bacteria)]|uniref:flavin-containing monooxygenase n=1 Tax=Rhodococcus sp. TaxID=1831 RepID=UPI001207C9B5|nr:NAD(P)/FAD-dependent oxidoreductase [Rhodococcus sp. (in: high G+C Gram-positive bacteria)]RZL24922.1 MAG: NAD(P)/FAD-dependent oxidoreductase [Rhodococcus sp. (in: high G+C Gram-positive bacteria)]